MNTPERSRKLCWFPGRSTVRDAPGETIGPAIGGREFSPRAETRYNAVNTLRWSLGIT